MLTAVLSVLALVVTPDHWIETSGLDRFWEIHEVLASDAVPSDEQWRSMFGAPGYAQIDRVERRSSWMKPVFEHAYRPSKVGVAHDWGRLEEYVTTMILPHLSQVEQHRETLDELVVRFSRPATLSEAIRVAQAWLPAGAARREDVPPVYLVILDGDSKALNESIVVDAYGIACAPDPTLVLAHELHHVFRQSIDRVQRDDVPRDHADIVRLLTQLEQEGVAEMIDKREHGLDDTPLPEATQRHPLFSWAWARHRAAMERSLEFIDSLDRALLEIADDPTRAGPVGTRLSESMNSVERHAIGLLMADTIAKRLGRARLIETVGDPFAFVLAFDEAAAHPDNDATRTRSLSDDATDLIRRWREQFASPGA